MRGVGFKSLTPQAEVPTVARGGKWKLLAYDGEPHELFDLEADPLEKASLLAEHPEIAEELTAELRAFLAEPRDRSGFVSLDQTE